MLCGASPYFFEASFATMSTVDYCPSPSLFFRSVSAYQQTAIIKAAIELGLFAKVEVELPKSVQTIAAEIGAAEKGTRVLCDLLSIIGFLIKEEGLYRSTPDTALFLDSRSPAYLGGAIDFLLSPQLTAGFAHFTEAVKRGGTTLADSGVIADDNPTWVTFARAMAPVMALPARLMANALRNELPEEPRRILDIAAGHGLFGIAALEEFTSATVEAIDWTSVLQVARENAELAGVIDRCAWSGGDAFKVDWGQGSDLVLFTNFIHHFGFEDSVSLLRRAHSALRPGGHVAILEFVPNENRTTPIEPAFFSGVMLASTPKGDAYTFEELAQMGTAAGFGAARFVELPPSIQSLVLLRKEVPRG